MQLAFYKGRKRLFDQLVQWWTRSSYSHTELVLSTAADGSAECASSSFIDGGVRIKHIMLDPERWDVVDLRTDVSEEEVRQWYANHLGQQYDLLGLLGFIIPIRSDPNRWFCSESNAAASGYVDPWRYSPAILAARHGLGLIEEFNEK